MSNPNTRLALYLLHGVGENPTVWQDIVSELAISRPLRAPWLPGLKPTDQRCFTFADAAGALASEIELQGSGQADVTGHALGAMVALQLALDCPKFIHRLILIDGQAKPPAGQLRSSRLVLRLMPRSRLEAQGITKPRLMEVLDAMADFDVRERLGEINAPTLVLVGADNRGDLEGAEQLAQGIPDARLHLIPGGGPQLTATHPKELARLIREFVKETDG